MRGDLKGIFTCVIVFDVDRSTDIRHEGIDSFILIDEWMPDGTIRSIDHIGIRIGPDR